MNWPSRLVNLTPHPVVVVRHDGTTTEYPPDGRVARVSETRVPTGTLFGIPCSRVEFGDVSGVPEQAADAGGLPYDGYEVYIVSAMVATRLKGRHDIVSPGPLVRDERGQVVGCEGFTTW